MLVVLAACGAPIANDPLVDEVVFVDAWPTAERVASTTAIRRARVGDSAVLAAAVISAAGYDDLIASLVASGEALRAQTAAERTATLRRWDPAVAGTLIGGDAYAWYARGEVRRPLGQETLEWTLELAPDESGPWQLVGAGGHDPSDAGWVAWDIDKVVVQLGIPVNNPIGELEVAYDRTTGARQLVAELPPAAGVSLQYAMDGDVYAWSGWFAVEEGGDVLPGVATVVHTPDLGGRGFGELYAGPEVRPWEACWDADGVSVWLDGAVTVPTGREKACPVAADMLVP